MESLLPTKEELQKSMKKKISPKDRGIQKQEKLRMLHKSLKDANGRKARKSIRKKIRDLKK